MVSRFRKAFSVTAVLLGGLVTAVVIGAPAQADADDCMEYLRSITGSAPTSEMEIACNQAASNGVAGRRACVSILRSEGLVAAAVFEACRRGAPPEDECPAFRAVFVNGQVDNIRVEVRDAELIRATVSSCTYQGDVFLIDLRAGTVEDTGRRLSYTVPRD